MTVKQRQLVERTIAEAAIDSALAKGYKLSVDNGADGDDDNVRDFETLSADKADILSRMFQTDEDYLFVWQATGAVAKYGDRDATTGRAGWIRFIYGNSGWDVISDYSDNDAINSVLDPVNVMVDKIEAGEYKIVVEA